MGNGYAESGIDALMKDELVKHVVQFSLGGLNGAGEGGTS